MRVCRPRNHDHVELVYRLNTFARKRICRLESWSWRRVLTSQVPIPCPTHLPHRLTGLQRAADQRYDCRRSVDNVPGGEAEKSVSGIDQAVLAAVVCGEPLAMRCAVVLDREPSVGIVGTGAGQEEPEIIAKGNLAPRMRQSRQNQDES